MTIARENEKLKTAKFHSLAELCFLGGISKSSLPATSSDHPPRSFASTRRRAALSTHDQVLGGANGQIFLGCRFPADAAYRLEVEVHGAKVAQALASKGVLGRFSVDFLSVKEGDAWRHLAIEINLRKGGTTHPFLMLEFLTDGRYAAETGEFLAPAGRPRWYYASDNLESPRYRGLTPYDLIDIAGANGLHFRAATDEGVTFHLMGALSEFGKLGVAC